MLIFQCTSPTTDCRERFALKAGSEVYTVTGKDTPAGRRPDVRFCEVQVRPDVVCEGGRRTTIKAPDGSVVFHSCFLSVLSAASPLLPSLIAPRKELLTPTRGESGIETVASVSIPAGSARDDAGDVDRRGADLLTRSVKHK